MFTQLKIKKLGVVLLLTVNCIVTAVHSIYAGGNDSTFKKLSSDMEIIGTSPTVVLSSTLSFSTTRTVLIVSDGRYYPTNPGIAVVKIRIDGDSSLSNRSIINSASSLNPVQHSFNCIAVATLGVGTHTFQLVAHNHTNTPSARFVVGADSGISILTDPAPNVVSSALSTNSGQINVTTQGIGGRGPIPTVTVLSNSITTSSPTLLVALASGSVYKDCGEGDALWGIYLNDQCPSNDEAVWTVNDIFSGAELQAPMYTHSLYQLFGNNTLSLKASELSFVNHENAVCYRIRAKTRLILLWGMQVVGSTIVSTESCFREDWVCIGSSSDWPGCLHAGSRTAIASTTFTVPGDHNGVILFMAKTRFQPDRDDTGG